MQGGDIIDVFAGMLGQHDQVIDLGQGVALTAQESDLSVGKRKILSEISSYPDRTGRSRRAGIEIP